MRTLTIVVLILAVLALIYVGQEQNTAIQRQRALILLQQQDSAALNRCQIALNHCTGAVPPNNAEK